MKLPVILPRPHREFRNAVGQLMIGAIRYLVLVGDYGLGKTSLLGWVLAKFSWPEPTFLILNRIQDHDGGRRYNLAAVLEIAERLGIVEERNRARGHLFFRLHFQAVDAPAVGGLTVLRWLKDVAVKLGKPRPDPLKCLFLFGIEAEHRIPILVTAEVGDTVHSLSLKILDALGVRIHAGGWLALRSRLREILDLLPVVLFIDQADLLERNVLESLLPLGDGTATPICLAGAEQLADRLRAGREKGLRAIGTRVGVHIRLTELTLPELSDALPALGREAILALWSAGQGNFRTINMILESLARLQQENPGLRLTRRSIDIAAEDVLARGPLKKLAVGDRSRDEDVEAAEQANGHALMNGKQAMRQRAPGAGIVRKAVRPAG